MAREGYHPVLPPLAGVPIPRRDRGRLVLPAFFMLAGASVVVRSGGRPSPASSEHAFAGFLLWLLGLLLSFHRLCPRPFWRAAADSALGKLKGFLIVRRAEPRF